VLADTLDSDNIELRFVLADTLDSDNIELCFVLADTLDSDNIDRLLEFECKPLAQWD